MTQETLEFILKLRQEGLSLNVIGRHVGKDHSTVLWHCKKHGVEPEKPLKRRYAEAPAPLPPSKISKYDHLFSEQVNKGCMTYQEYLDRAGLKVVEL